MQSVCCAVQPSELISFQMPKGASAAPILAHTALQCLDGEGIGCEGPLRVGVSAAGRMLVLTRCATQGLLRGTSCSELGGQA